MGLYKVRVKYPDGRIVFMSDTNNDKPVWEGSKADAEIYAAQRRACYRTTVYEVVPSELPTLDQPSGTIEEFEATLEAEANNPPTISDSCRISPRTELRYAERYRLGSPRCAACSPGDTQPAAAQALPRYAKRYAQGKGSGSGISDSCRISPRTELR